MKIQFQKDIQIKGGIKKSKKTVCRKCDKCEKEIKTTYSPDRKEIIYCEECYNKEVY